MPIRTLLSAALATLMLSACEPAPTPDTDPHRQPVAAVASGGNAFQVRVTVSEAAAAALEANDESILITADYFGYASVAAQQRQLAGAEEPWLSLARHQVELAAAGSADFPEVSLDTEQLQLVEEGRPHLRVNVGSASAVDDDTGEAELLDCGTFQDTLAAAVRTGVDIDCKLIAE